MSNNNFLLLSIFNDMYNNNNRTINNLIEQNNNIRVNILDIHRNNVTLIDNLMEQNNNIRNDIMEIYRNIRVNTNNNEYPLVFTYSTVLPTNNFFDSINIIPTNQQIINATSELLYSDILNPVNTSCPISLEAFNDSSRVTIIRQCRHIFNTESLNNWFSTNCKCPICRYDIREYTNQTSENTNQTSENTNQTSENTTIPVRNTNTIPVRNTNTIPTQNTNTIPTRNTNTLGDFILSFNTTDGINTNINDTQISSLIRELLDSYTSNIR